MSIKNLLLVEENLVLWLDIDEDVEECHKRQRFSEIQVSRFKSVDECENYIRHNGDHRVVLIVNGLLTPEIIRRLHSLRSILAIYIRSPKKTNQEEWNSDLRKVR